MTKIGSSPKVFDLFAGAGGFSLGLKQAGFQTLGMLEIDAWACNTLRYNFPEVEVVNQSIESFKSLEFFKKMGQNPDLIIGGPPCQGYSLCRRGKGEPGDQRNKLVFEFLRIIRETLPSFFIMENVANLAKAKNRQGQFVRNILQEEIENLGYNFYINVLNAADFGVPQMRMRCFIIGSKIHLDHPFPHETHFSNNQADFLKGLLPTPTLWDAISDLPALSAGEGYEESDFHCAPRNDYQRTMRGKQDVLYNHKAMSHSKRTVERFRSMAWGQSVSDVPEHLKPRRRNSEEISKSVYDQNNRRLFPEKPSNTIPASFYANFVHPYQDRNFTAREGARIQSFPDSYKFLGKPTLVSRKLLKREGRDNELHLCQYNQIGNAVPPLLGQKIGEQLKEFINACAW